MKKPQQLEPEQKRLIPEPDVKIVLDCPRCGYVWHAASVLSGAWWGSGVTAEAIAKICYCPMCEAPPPMWTRKEAIPR